MIKHHVLGDSDVGFSLTVAHYPHCPDLRCEMDNMMQKPLILFNNLVLISSVKVLNCDTRDSKACTCLSLSLFKL